MIPYLIFFVDVSPIYLILALSLSFIEVMWVNNIMNQEDCISINEDEASEDLLHLCESELLALPTEWLKRMCIRLFEQKASVRNFIVFGWSAKNDVSK